jgi:hypothetical protein
MTASLDMVRLMNNARVHLPGAIDANLQLELFNVLNDFLQNSNVWQTTIPVPVVVGTSTYTLAPVTSASISRLVAFKNSATLDVPATMAVPGTLVLNTIPSQSDASVATVALTVDDPLDTDGNPIFPAWILNKYNTGILDGLIARMMMQPAKPYTNAQLAIFRMKKFIAAVSQAKFEALHANLNNGQTWRFPQSFNSRHAR